MAVGRSGQVSVGDVRTTSREVPTRMPFRFGNAVMESMEVVGIEARVTTAAGEVVGVGESVLSPLWFDKDPARSYEVKEAALRRSIALASEAAQAAGAATPQELHRVLWGEVLPAARAEGINDLAASFGVALLELAVVDAVCLDAGCGLHAALKSDLLGCGPELAALLPARPATEIAVRHTVGLGDPLTASDQDERLDDGLPETLEEVIAHYGVRWFKIKVCRDVGATVERLCRIAAVLDSRAPDYRVTLDGNEDFQVMSEVVGFVRAAAAEPRLAKLWPVVELLEQPVHRDHALHADVVAPLAEVQRFKPVILDESDACDDTFERAWELGYSGVSAKSCKGLFRTLDHVRFIAAHRTPERPGILSSEDLTCPPLVSLHKDLEIDAALGMPHTERNAHHYVRGLDHLSVEERSRALERYPSLYHSPSAGLVTLRISDGVLSLPEEW